jgi:hypothetical protein
LPIVVYLGYSIHGNESSGTGAAIAFTTSLLQKSRARKNTRKTIILLDPSFERITPLFHMGKQ